MKNGCRLRAMVSKWEGNDIWFLYVINFYLAKISQGNFYLAKISQGNLLPCQILASNLLPCQISFVSPRTHHRLPRYFQLDIFSCKSFYNLVFSRHKALSCNFAIYRGAQRLQKENWGDRSLYINLEIYKALFFSLLLFFPISIFLVAKQPLRTFPQRMIG